MPFQLTKIISELAKLNFTEKEIVLYLNLRRLGPSRIQDVAEAIKQNRTTTSNYLKNLINKGLISKTNVNGKKLFVAEGPEKLRSIVKEKIWNIERMRASFSKLVDAINNIYPVLAKSESGSKIEYLEGEKALNDFFITLNKQKQIYAFFNPESVYKSPLKDAQSFIKKFSKKKCKSFEILLACRQAEKYTKKLDGNYNQYCYIPENNNISVGSFVFDNSAVFINFDKSPTAIFIQNPRIINTMKMILKIIWVSCNKFKI